MHPSVRILYICHDGDLYGSQQSLNLIVKNLPPETYHCFVSVARPGPLNDLLAQYPNVTVLNHQRLQWVKHDARTPLQRIGDALTVLLLIFPRTWQLINTIKREKINVVHTNSTVSLEGPLAAALTRTPHVWHIRELFMQDSPKFHLVFGKRLSRWMMDYFSDRVICISQIVREQFGHYLKRNPGKYRLIYNALEWPHTNWEAAAPAMRTGAFRVGYIGRLSEGKRFHDLLDAVALLRRKGVRVELVAAGNFVDDAYKAKIEERLLLPELKNAVQLLGYQENLDSVYASIDMLAVPSANEPFGRVVIEAMAHGIPCVGNDSGGIPEIISQGETGLMVPLGDVPALAFMIEELMTDGEKRFRLRDNALRMVAERFTIEAQIEQLDECYRSILTHHQP